MRARELRNTDWRFLLPEPRGGCFEHLLLLGGTAELAHCCLAEGLAHRVSLEPSPGQADALVLLNSSNMRLSEVRSKLLPASPVYIEIENQLWVDLNDLGRRLRALELEPTGVYLVEPNLEHAAAYIPLDQPQILPWYYSTFEPSARYNLLSSVVARQPASRLVTLGQPIAITALAAPALQAPISALEHPRLPEELKRPDLRCIFLTGGDALNRLVLLPFAPGVPHPLVVCKLVRRPSRNDSTVHEQYVLKTLNHCLDPEMRMTIPKPHGLYHWRELVMGLEDCAPGYPLSKDMQRWGVSLKQKITDLELVVDWLIKFHRQARAMDSIWSERLLKNWVRQPLSRYTAAFGGSTEAHLFNEIEYAAGTLLGMPLPRVWTHWGLEMRNIFREDDRVTVIDWEGGSAGLPLLDLFYFETQWYLMMVRAMSDTARLNAFRQLYLEHTAPDALVTAVRRALGRYVAELNIAPGFVPIMFVILWTLRALGRWQRSQALQREGAPASNVYVRYVELIAGSIESLRQNFSTL